MISIEELDNIAPGRIEVERLGDLPLEEFAVLLAESEWAGLGLRAGWPRVDERSEPIDRPGEALFGAWIGREFVGLGG